MSQVPPPDLRVIDRAIDNIESGRGTFTCIALENAYWAEHVGVGFWQYARVYVDQYRKYTLKSNNRFPPVWWNSPEPYKAERIAALNAFRQACVDAANKETK